MKCVITTIFSPTSSTRKLAARINAVGSELVVVGDKKGPASFDLEGTFFLPLSEQNQLPFQLAGLLPTGHYARKNLGYLWALAKKTPCLYETDDDNAPDGRWRPRECSTQAIVIERPGWVNIYRLFSDDKMIWPRGFPLNRIRENGEGLASAGQPPATVFAPIQQGLADLSPDVDAVWRLVCDRPFFFREGPEICLAAGSWCPFNSQNTWWWPEAYPLMYLPSYCSFRMTDIWRSFVAQRCLWAMGKGVVFFSADVVQERNEHDLQKDFEAEIPGYTANENLVRILERLSLASGPDNALANLLRCYEALVAAELFPTKELDLVKAWSHDLESIRGIC